MNLVMKMLLAMGLLVAGAAGGAYLHSQFVSPLKVLSPPEVVTRTVTQIVTRPIPFPSPVPSECPTPTETTITTHETETVTNTVRAEIRRDWSLGLGWDARHAFERDYLPASAELSRRTFGDWWLTSGWNWRRGELLLGVKYEF